VDLEKWVNLKRKNNMLKPGTIVALAKGIANREDHGGGFKGAVKGVVKGVTGNDQIDFLREIAKNTSNMKDMSSDSKPGAAGQLPVPEVEQSRKVNKKTLKCNKPRRTPGHKTKSHIVKACSAGKEKIIRFGQQGKKVNTLSGTAGKPKAGESAKMKAKRKSFKARHAKNIAKGKMSAAYWADKVKW